MFNGSFTQILLLALGAILIVVAVIDARTFKISNRANMVVAAMAPLYWWASGLGLWPGVALQIGVALAVFAVLAAAFYVGVMGGGDVKLAAAIALWFPPHLTVKFLVVLSIAGGVLTLLLLLTFPFRKRKGPLKIPYGVAIAFGGLAIIAQLGGAAILTQRFLNQFV